MAVLANLQRWLDEAAARHDVPGAAVAVGVGDDLVEAATGVVNRDTGVETTTDSVFQIGSVTKIWTSALVMQLVGEGLADLDAPVRRYLPEFGVVDADATAAVTVRQLLTHTGGFDGDLFEDTGRGDDAVDRLLSFMHTGATQVSPPGELFSYSNAGFCVLGVLAARLRGGTWESVLRERLIDPLGVTHMALFPEEAIRYRAAIGHHTEEDDGPQVLVPMWQLPRSNAPAGSTPCAAPRELVRFGRMFLADGVAADGTRVLPAGTFAAMREAQVVPPWVGRRYPSGWGLGFMLFDWNGRPVVGHDGGTPGQTACWRIVPDRDVVFAVNANGGGAAALIDDVMTAVLKEVADIDVPRRERPPAEPVPFDANGYTGTFAGPLTTYEVAVADGGLEVTTTPKGIATDLGIRPKTARYLALGQDRFVAAEPDEGAHPVIVFVDQGRYLHNSRALPRVG